VRAICKKNSAHFGVSIATKNPTVPNEQEVGKVEEKIRSPVRNQTADT